MRTATVFQGSVPYRASVKGDNERRAGRKETRSSSRRTDSCAFLNTKIIDIPVTETDIFIVDLNKSYDVFVKGLKKFYKMMHRKLVLPKQDKASVMLGELIEWVQIDLQNVGLYLSVWRVYDDEELNFTVFKNVHVLEDTLFTFYLSPADTLNKELSCLYKRFIKYAGDCLGTNIVIDGSSNYYLDMIVNMMFDDIPDDDEGYAHEKRLIDVYTNGHIKELYEEINKLVAEPNKLVKDLEAYRKKAEGKEIDLVELLIDGMDILPYMHMWRYDFNPYNDGFEENEGFMDIASSIAFVYNHNDGLEEMLIDTINNDMNCGIVSTGWNKYVHIDTGFTKEDVDFLVSNDNIQKDFVDWTYKYYNLVTKEFNKRWD